MQTLLVLMSIAMATACSCWNQGPVEVNGRCATYGLPRYINGQRYPAYTTDAEITVFESILSNAPPAVSTVLRSILDYGTHPQVDFHCGATAAACLDACYLEGLPQICIATCNKTHVVCDATAAYFEGVPVATSLLHAVVEMAPGLIGASRCVSCTECCCLFPLAVPTAFCLEHPGYPSPPTTCETVCHRAGAEPVA